MVHTTRLSLALGAAISVLSGCVVPDLGLWPAVPNRGQASLQPATLPVPLRLETDDGRACHGVRLDDRHAATAAHCVQGSATITLFENGIATLAEALVVNPGYAVQTPETAAGADLARLTAAASPGSSAPVVVGMIEPRAAQILSLAPSGAIRQTECAYLGRSGAIVELSCQVDLGWSGAPVVQDGVLVGIVSARGTGAALAVVQMADAMRLAAF
jgi:hypothetical protein